MRCEREAFEVEVCQYEGGKHLEDGFERWADVVTRGWIVTDFLIKIPRDDGSIVCPYVNTRRGRVFIGEGDYVIIEDDGSKHICGADKVFKRYKVIE